MRRHVPLAEVLKRVLPDEAKKRIYSVELIEKRWEQAVGAELARRSEPEVLNAGVLTVRVTDPAWGRMIVKLQGRIVPALNRALGTSLVRRINFQKRSELRRPREPVAVERTASPAKAPEAVASAAASIRDPELRELVSRSAANYLRAQERRRRN